MNTKILRQKILDLAIRGKLVPQDPQDENASVLLEAISKEKGIDIIPIDKSDVPFEIPENWEWVKLGDICTKLLDGDHNPPSGEKNETKYIMASSTNINNDKLVDLEKVRYLSKEKYEKAHERTNVTKGDILFTSVGTLGRSCIYNQELNITFQRSVTVLTTLISNKCLKFLLDSQYIQNFIENNAKGTAQRGFYINQMKSLEIPIPPLNEQIRIVEAIENFNKQIEIIEENQNQLQTTAKYTKSKILDLAIRGKLVPQNSTDGTATDLLQQIRTQKAEKIAKGELKQDKNTSFIFKSDDGTHYEQFPDGTLKDISNEIPFDIPHNWAWCRLREIGIYKKGPFGSALTKSMFIPKSETTIKVYEQKNAIQKNITLGNYYIPYSYFESDLQGFEVSPGDIIVSCAGTIGETFTMPNEMEKGIINQALMKMSISDKINITYFLHYFDFILKANSNESGKGTAIKNIPPFDIFKNFFFPFPPVEEQKRIVEAIESIITKLEVLG